MTAAIQELTKKELRELEAELVAERARLERSLEVQSDGVAGPAVGFAASAPTTEAGGVALALATRTHDRYSAILDALARIDAGTYGVCVSCDGRIPFGRLLVMPETARCVACGPRL
jgi:DnaK suppressor protein